ncbi:unnamed protein product, partial [Rotaria socialis]
MADYSKTIELYNKALQIFETHLPRNHPSVATSYSNLGGVYYKISDYPMARKFYETAHKIFENVLLPNHT